MPNDVTNSVPLAEAAPLIRDGDLLLWRRRGFIAIAGRGRHSHAAKSAWWDGDLFCLEMREFAGGRAVTLASQVRRAPGRIDVYETNPEDRWPEYDRAAATRAMRRKAGEDYSYAGIVRAALLHLPLVRIFARPCFRDDRPANDLPEFCSQACASADRVGGGVDPVPNLGDRLTEPADLARSPFYRYRCTLIPALLCVLLLLFAQGGMAQPCPGGRCPTQPQHESAPAAVVRLRNETPGGISFGSGTIIEVGANGVAILSCAHLFEEGQGSVTRIMPTGQSAPAELIAIDRRFDLSLLVSRFAPGEAIDTTAAVSVANEHASAGMPVVSAGFGPIGSYRSVAGRVLGYARTGGTDGYETLVVSGAARPGDSGGPILNSQGELVAVLWGTDRTRIVGTYCGRVRNFLDAARQRLRERLAPRAPPAVPQDVPSEDQAEARPSLPLIRDGLADRAPDLLLWALSLAGISLSPWAVLGIRAGWRIHRRRRRRQAASRAEQVKLESGGSIAGAVSEGAAASAGSSTAARNDQYAAQLNHLMQTYGGRSTAQDATLGREYDRLLADAETSSEAVIAKFARQTRQRGRTAFERIHADEPLPAEPVM